MIRTFFAFFLCCAIASAEELDAKILESNGSAVFSMNVKPTPLLIYRDHYPQNHMDTVKRFKENGFPITTFTVNPARPLDEQAGMYKYVDSQIAKVLKESPNSYFLILITTAIKSDSKLAKENPAELTVWPPGTKSDKQTEMEPGDRMSEASEFWQNLVAQNIYDLVKHIRTSSYSDRVIGYLLTGPPGEWTDWYDFSQPALNAFRQWLKEKYKTNADLRSAWHNNNVTFENAQFPEWKGFFNGDFGIFFDPVKSRAKIDFWEFHHSLPAKVVALFARKIKEASEGKSLVGLYHGYFTGVEWDGREDEPFKISYFRMRHKSLDKITSNPDVDFIAAPYNYQERQAGGVFDHSLIPDTVLLNGKMLLIEDDTRTHQTTAHAAYGQCEKLGNNFGQAANLDEALGMIKRNFAGTFSKPGSGMWFFGLGNDGHKWWDNPEILSCLKVLGKTASEKLIAQDRGASQIAVIGSYKAVCGQAFNNLPKEFITRQLTENLHRIGAPFDLYLDSDLINPRFPFARYKLFIFLNSFFLDDADRSVIKEKICTGGRTVVWIYAAGISDGKTLSIKNTESLTGIKLGMADISLSGLRCVVDNFETPFTKGLPTNLRFGPDKLTRPVSPVLWNADPDAVKLGYITATTPEYGIWTFLKSGLCMKKFDNWTSVWSPLPNLPSSFLREAARASGVHIYDNGDDQVMASSKLLAVHAAYDGNRHISLPEKCSVLDPFTDKYIIQNSDSFDIYLKKGETGFWIIEKSRGAE